MSDNAEQQQQELLNVPNEQQQQTPADAPDQQETTDPPSDNVPYRRHGPHPLPPPIPPPPFPGLPQHILLIYNVSKSSNIGPLIRTAVAFSCSAIVVVGARKLLTHGNKHTNRFATFRHYERLTEAVTHLKAQQFTLIGLELSADATELSTTPPPFTPRTCFIPGNEGSGLSPTLLPHLDRLLYIRQSGCGTASLNVSVATGIVLYGFQQWAGYPEQGREGGEGGEAGLAKYRVDDEKAVGSGGWKIARQDTERHREQGEPQQQQQQQQQGVVAPVEGEQEANAQPQSAGDDTFH